MEYVVALLVFAWLIHYVSDEKSMIYRSAQEQSTHIVIEAKQEAKAIINQAHINAASIIDKANSEKQLVDNFLKSKIKDYPVVATVIADYETAYDTKATELLLLKKHPCSLTTKEERKKITESKKQLIMENKALKWEMEYLRKLTPWLYELEENTIESQQPDFYNTNNVNEDEVSYWLTPNEYQELSITEKNQRALDRYKKRHKSKAEIGREYERYIGYLYEQDGYNVDYFGIKNGVEDLGRDLICRRGNDVLIVQCKCWSNMKGKIIHEKYINQLYGTTLEYYYEHVSKNLENYFIPYEYAGIDTRVIPVFISTVPLSDKAREFAEVLEIQCRQILLGDYPMIKCNINQTTGEKIYHLPFDQQYDKCIITPETGEFYAMTVAEAEEAGFRRAMRWKGIHFKA